MVRIALDLMGGDRAPEEIKAGAFMYAEYLRKRRIEDVELTVIGLPRATAEFEKFSDKRFKAVVCDDYLPMDVKPTDALRRKGSSMYVGTLLLREGKVDAFVSAGNTGALLACATLVVGRIQGVERPALAVPIPSLRGFTVLIDAGANAEVKPEWLTQFAIMGVEYAKLLGKNNPTVGLLNIGTEENKGTEREKQAFALLKERFKTSFVGNVEGNDIALGTADVVVTDGFSGNVAMKSMEGAAKLITSVMKREIRSGVDGIVGSLLMFRVFRRLKKKLDPRTYGGTFFLGVNGVVVKAHGNSDRVAIRNALEVARMGVATGLTASLKHRIAEVVSNPE